MIGTALLLAVPMEMVGVVAKVVPSPVVVWMNVECWIKRPEVEESAVAVTALTGIEMVDVFSI